MAMIAPMLKTKAAIGVLVAVIAVGAGIGTAAAAAANGAFGQQVQKQVHDCKQGNPTNGTRGIGQCVSDFAQQHGKQQQQQPQQQSHTAISAFGQQVKEQVQDCKQGKPTNGTQGIGECVSDFAQQHGKQQQQQHH